MQISEVIKNYNLSYIRLDFPEKKYLYTCTLDNALNLKKDFIFLPFCGNKDVTFSLISEAFKNPCCKGFIINKNLLSSETIKAEFHSFMKQHFNKLEAVLLAGNIYNLAYNLAEYNSKHYKVQTIAITGTEETSTIRDILKASTDKSFSVSFPCDDWDCWQKSLETLLSADENLDWAILEIIPQKKHLVDYAGKFYKLNVLFTKSSISNLNVWNDLEELSEELVKIIDNPERVLSVYTYEDNEFINNKISYKLQKKLHLIQDGKINISTKLSYLNRCYALAYEFLKNSGIEPVSIENIEEENPRYSEFNINRQNYFILNKDRISLNSVKEALSLFFEKYPNQEKIVIFEHITGLGDYKQSAYADIFEYLAKLNPSVLILIDTKAFLHLFKRYNNKTYVKYFPYNPEEIKLFLDGISKSDSAIFVSTLRDLPFIKAEVI